MKREPSAWTSALVALALGLLLGLRQAGDILAPAVARLVSMDALPRPRTMDWIGALRPGLALLVRLEPVLAAVSLALAVWFLVRLLRELSPEASLRLNPAAPPGPWHTVPLDDRVARRAAVAAFFCFYLAGGFRWAWQA